MSEDRRMPDLEARFDAELSRAARSLVTEGLPRGVLDASLVPGAGRPIVRSRRTAPAFAGLAAAAVLLLATAIALAPGGLGPTPSAPTTTASGAPFASPSAAPGPSGPSPSGSTGPVVHGSFRSTSAIQSDLETLRYSCSPGGELLPTGPSPSAMIREGAICTAPADAGPYMAVVIVGEARDGRVVELHVKADLTGEDTPAAREAVAVPLAKAVAIAAAGQGAGNQVAAWILDAVPMLAPSTANSTVLLGFSVKVVRSSSGSYQLVAHPV